MKKILLITTFLIINCFSINSYALDCNNSDIWAVNRCTNPVQPTKLKTTDQYSEYTGGTPNPCCLNKCVTNAAYSNSNCNCINGFTENGTACVACSGLPTNANWNASGTGGTGTCKWSCNSSYHQNGSVCESNTRACADNQNRTGGSQTWNGSSWNACVYTACVTGFHSTDNFVTCVTNTPTCSSIGLAGAGGAATWTGTDYNRTSCYKDTTGIQTSSGNGTGTKRCYWTSGTDTSAIYDTNCSMTAIATCIAGYYYNSATNSTDCIKTEQGYYSGNGSTTKQNCPGGSTSDTGATNKTDCFIMGGTSGTIICDVDNKCFTLPDIIKINYSGS